MAFLDNVAYFVSRIGVGRISAAVFSDIHRKRSGIRSAKNHRREALVIRPSFLWRLAAKQLSQNQRIGRNSSQANPGSKSHTERDRYQLKPQSMPRRCKGCMAWNGEERRSRTYVVGLAVRRG
jgi:hypothetical protein